MTQTVDTKDYTDIKRLIWIEKFIPKAVRPYAYLMRLDRPIGIWLLLLPGLWGIFFASNGYQGLTQTTLLYISLFCIGALIMRAAGCVINDLWDRDLDRMVERTKDRPIANGSVTPRHAIIFLATLLLFGLTILLQFNSTTQALGILTLPLIATYPLMKRITWWPQAFLGITFNFSALMGYSAVTNTISLPAFLLYAGCFFWTIGYDTIYAHQDKEDDTLAGIKSTAIKFGKHSKLWVSIFYSLSILCIILAIIIENETNFQIATIILPVAHLIWQIKSWNPQDQYSSLKIFKSNYIFGILVLISIIMPY